MNDFSRLPRPALALGTLGLFVFAMVDPLQFAERMKGLAYVPEPLWWLLGAVVSFYFGSREMHYFRGGVKVSGFEAPSKPTRSEGNAATDAWRNNR